MNIIGFWVMSVLTVLLGIVGVVIAARAHDFGATFFGLGLAVFAVIYNYWAVLYYDANKA
ncbi:hypothetical protein [Ferrovibrio sp.]|uniref:hypothetical protein n=1 Tax=Ferrovibrio sp. TaxID=1917215 RepID=UPI0025BF6F17|nr:hypothetical protein [Ferrovibrio sp.]MBX3454419.1 hypothetical protein [Ferrovibrio sp.]